MGRLNRVAAAAAVAALVLTSAACGSDDGDDDAAGSATDSASGSGSSSSTAPELSAEQTAACAALVEYQQVMGSIGPASPDAKTIAHIQELMADIAAGTTGQASAAAQGVVDTIQESIDTKNKKLLDSDEFFMSLLAPAVAGRDVCGYTPVDFAVEEMPGKTKQDLPMFHFTGVPESTEAGTYSFGITNKGKNFHEAVLVKVGDDFSGDAEELLALPMKKFFGAVDQITATYMPPGAAGYLNADLGSPGHYVLFCHIPLEGKDHRPVMGDHGPVWHYDLGMLEDIEVS